MDEKLEPPHVGSYEMLSISLAEKAGALVLLSAAIVVGLYPKVLLDLIGPSLNSPLFERMWKGGVS
jgi:NADH-quinone oxidoreductase subunit M